LRKVALFPPFICLIIGVLVGAVGGCSPIIEPVLERIGSTLAPLALFSVGLKFRLQFERGQLPAAAAGLAWKLVLAPLIVYLVGDTLDVTRPILTIAVLESAMAPLISATIRAEQDHLEPSLGNTILGIGIVLSCHGATG
jgi:malate permease and related proteins